MLMDTGTLIFPHWLPMRVKNIIQRGDTPYSLPAYEHVLIFASIPDVHVPRETKLSLFATAELELVSCRLLMVFDICRR